MMKWYIFINMNRKLVWKTTKRPIQGRALFVALDYFCFYFYFTELAQKQFFTGVSKNTSL